MVVFCDQLMAVDVLLCEPSAALDVAVRYFYLMRLRRLIKRAKAAMLAQMLTASEAS